MKFITHYIFGPADLWRLIVYIAKVVYKKLRSLTKWDFVKSIGIAVVLTVFRYVWDMGNEGLFFWGFFLWMLLFKKDSRIAIGAALAGLVCIPILLVLDQKLILFEGEEWAEMVAVWVYFFLVIGVAIQIIEFKRDGGDGEREMQGEKKVKKSVQKVKRHKSNGMKKFFTRIKKLFFLKAKNIKKVSVAEKKEQKKQELFQMEVQDALQEISELKDNINKIESRLKSLRKRKK